MIRRLGGIHKNFNMPVLKNGDKKKKKTKREKAEMLAKIFAKANSSSNLTVEADKCRERESKERIPRYS